MPSPRPAADLRALAAVDVLRGPMADVAVTREESRQRLLLQVGIVLALVAGWLWGRILLGHATDLPGPPHIPDGLLPYMPAIGFGSVLVVAVVAPLLGAGRSPH